MGGFFLSIRRKRKVNHMRKTLLMTTALVVVIGATDAYSQGVEDLIVNDTQKLDNQGAEGNPYYYQSINVGKDGNLTLNNSKIKSEQDITINGTFTANDDSTLEAGNDNGTSAVNMSLIGATATLTDSDLEATGNITIKDTNLISTSEDEGGYGIWANGDISVEDGEIELTKSYLEADGNIIVSGGNHTLNSGKITSKNGNINIEGGETKLTDSYITANGDIVINGGKHTLNGSNITSENGNITIKDGDIISPEFSAYNGDVTLEGGTITEEQDTREDRPASEEYGINNINIKGGTFNHTNVVSDGFKNLNISGGTVNLTNTEMNAWDGNVNISNGEINLTGEGDSETGLYARKEFNITGGTINMKGGDTILNNIADYNETAYPAYDLNINGGTINVNAGNGEISSSKNVNINGGTINIAEGATLGIYGGNEKAETTALLGTNGIFNINGTLDTNIKGNGTINFNSNTAKITGDVNMSNGGIMNVGLNNATIGGDVTFASGSTLKLSVTDEGNGSVTANSITAEENSKLALTVTKAMEIDETINVTLFNSNNIDNQFTNEVSNARYKVSTEDGGTYSITYENSASDVVADAGGSVTNASTAEAWDSVSSSTTATPTTQAVANVLNNLSQHNPQAYVDALTAIAPDVAPVIQQTATETTKQVFNAVSTRLTGGSVSTGGKGASVGDRGHSMSGGHKGGQGHHNGHKGKSSGDNIFERAAMWVQGMFNKSELEDTSKAKGFDSETSGVVFGIEKFVSNETKVGVGYAYNNTEIDGFMRNTDVDTHTAILYGEYKPSQWYVNAVATYGWSDYSENKNVSGVNVEAQYDAETFGLQAMTGYEMNVNGVGVTPEAGLRYVHIKQDAYKDTAGQKVSGNESDIVTAVVGAKVNKTFELENGAYITPEVKLAATYDISNDDTNSIVTLANGSAYSVEGESLDEFGLEFGVGVTAELNSQIEFSVAYEGKFKEDYQDHTGMLNAKYKF